MTEVAPARRAGARLQPLFALVLGLAATAIVTATMFSVTAHAAGARPRGAATAARVSSRPGLRPAWSHGATATGPKTNSIAARGSRTHDDGRANFTVEVQGVESSYRTTPVFVMPGEHLSIRVTGAPAKVQAVAETGRLHIDEPGVWTWTAPTTPGAHACIRLTEQKRLDSICVKAFVLRPYHGEESLDGFRIGHYRRDLHEDDPAYALPEGFVLVSAEDVDESVSPHFKLGQFLCKQDGTYPKFLVLKTALVVKLEMLLEKLARDGVIADTLHVMSGYRTPFYNAAIGNETSYSRHSYGDAADVYVDRDADGIMDDIDGDGRSSTKDARVLYRLVDSTFDGSGPGRLAGGLAIYAPNRAHGPFVHVDTRGHRARW